MSDIPKPPPPTLDKLSCGATDFGARFVHCGVVLALARRALDMAGHLYLVPVPTLIIKHASHGACTEMRVHTSNTRRRTQYRKQGTVQRQQQRDLLVYFFLSN